VIPAAIPSEVADEARALAIRTFRAVDAAGMARVDFFLERSTDRLYVNEINTIPGFTPSSMFPKLWEAAGRPFSNVVDRLIELAIARHRARAARRLTFTPPSLSPNAPKRSSGGSL
jgi:D-alanine-D-alanine ligase